MEKSLWLLTKANGFDFKPIGPEVDFLGPVRAYMIDVREYGEKGHTVAGQGCQKRFGGRWPSLNFNNSRLFLRNRILLKWGIWYLRAFVIPVKVTIKFL